MASVQSVQRAFQILESLAVAPAGVSEISRRVSLPKSTVSRLLATLEEGQSVERTADGQTYQIGPAIVGLAASIESTFNLADLAHPHLQALSATTGEAAGLSIPDGYRVHYLNQVESSSAIQVRDWTGELIAMHLVPSGLVMMARWPAEAVSRYVARDLEATTPKSVVDADAIRSRLARIKTEGFAWVFEEYAEGINSVAAAVVDADDRVLGAVHIHGPAYRFPPPGRKGEVEAAVSAAADRVSRQYRRQRR